MLGVVAIGGGVDAGQTLAAFDKVKKRPTAQVRCSLVVRVIQKFAGGAGQEDGVVVLQVFRRDRRRIVGDGSDPGAGLVSQVFHHLRRQRDGSVYPTGGPAEDQHMAQALRRGVGLVRQRGHHRRDVSGIGKLFLRTAAGEAPAKSFRRASCGFRRSRGILCVTHRAGQYDGGERRTNS